MCHNDVLLDQIISGETMCEDLILRACYVRYGTYLTCAPLRSSWLWRSFSKGHLGPCGDATPMRPTALQVPEACKTLAIFTDHVPSEASDLILVPT